MSEPSWQQQQPNYPPPPPSYAPPPPPSYAPPPPGYAPPSTPYGAPASPYGAPAYGAPMMPAQTAGTNGMAIASLVCGIVGLCTGLAGVLAVIFGHMALSQLKQSGGIQQGRGMAIAGLVMGYIEIGLIVLYIFVLVIASASQ